MGVSASSVWWEQISKNCDCSCFHSPQDYETYKMIGFMQRPPQLKFNRIHTDMSVKVIVVFALLVAPLVCGAASSSESPAAGEAKEARNAQHDALQQLLAKRERASDAAHRRETAPRTRSAQTVRRAHLSEDEREIMTKQIMQAISAFVFKTLVLCHTAPCKVTAANERGGGGGVGSLDFRTLPRGFSLLATVAHHPPGCHPVQPETLKLPHEVQAENVPSSFLVR
ncbi:hypothetical protein F2P81_010616 [Scophthalmus maximus]|uniref:Uncharacterized protein n=1 Tax=Scophthalmus maximus TaxID=52904 RepID=A0A6A4T6B7_SCOMX|nr:hypothetical protein F2P81_010616 [Scophthalmus maximus]